MSKIAESPNTFPILEDYFDYMTAIQGRSQLTIKEYRYDLTRFFQFLIFYHEKQTLPRSEEDEATLINLSIQKIDIPFLNNIVLRDFYRFMTWISTQKNVMATTRTRKISAFKSFFNYLYSKEKIIDQNPVAELEHPKTLKKLPQYLSLTESQELLETVAHQEKDPFKARNYCILTLFLNCGLRLSELQGLNLNDVKEDRLKVLGKGGKERSIYLNPACVHALMACIEERKNLKKTGKDADIALFLSRQGNRLARRSIQLMIETKLKETGLDTSRISTHKLRHTAATLMYQYGSVDIRLLQEILGHASVATTEIYTHISERQLYEAVESNPLSSERMNKDKS